MASPSTDSHDPARIHTDARLVDTGHGHRVCGACPVPDIRGVVYATTDAAHGQAGSSGRGPGVDGPVQGDNRRRRKSVQGLVAGHHQANRPVCGVQRGLRVGWRRRQRVSSWAHYLRGHAHVPAARADR